MYISAPNLNFNTKFVIAKYLVYDTLQDENTYFNTKFVIAKLMIYLIMYLI
ncbi:hypothetical protein CHAB381_0388 [Campylobacter hominis ATCC BAA-381]|uniref:Uncharacterized protein n=1 Tax=Campylobacter hominis (strain ATCC BAA-381 / DSM 21671 / CCUG 45161 / LMG 19568 / NCTC 13146 / CH001A) TaxID=360107 RepID=A7I0E6_CAMHC|nr:hypothetical protein CHAB381_0388 [Campylobacter hominis ATCC BAA-381]